MYEIAKEFVDEQICLRFLEAPKFDEAARVENVLDIRAEFLELAVTLARVTEALFEDSNLAVDTALMKSALTAKQTVEEITEKIMLAMDMKESTSLNIDEAVVLAIANFYLGLMCRLCPDKKLFLFNDEEYFLRCVTLLSEHTTDPKAVITLTRGYDQLNDIALHSEEYNGINTTYARRILELYIEYVDEHDVPRKPIDIAREIGIDKTEVCENTDLSKLDVIFLNTFADFMDRYAANKVTESAFVVCLHRMMQLQLPKLTIFDVKIAWEWISTLCEVSVFFMECERFAEAKNYIATAEYVLANFHERELKGCEEEWSDGDLKYLNARLDFMRCVISRFWGIYGIELLLAATKDIATFEALNSSPEPSKFVGEQILFAKKPMSPLLFADIEDTASDSVRKIRTKVTHMRDAKKVFLSVLNNTTTAVGTCFSAKINHVIYTNITIEMSKAYKFLAHFETKTENKEKLCAKRVDIMHDVKNKCPSVKPEEVEKIAFHLALAHYSLMDVLFNEETLHMLLNKQTLSSLPQKLINSVVAIEDNLKIFIVNAEKRLNK